MAFRIATYNLHCCIGRDGVESPQRIAKVLRTIDADLLALQEVSHDPSAPGNVLEFLAEATGTQAIAGPTLLKAGGCYGNAMLSRVAPREVQRFDISVPGREPRGAIQLTLALACGTVSVLTTHLGLSMEERRRQMDRIAAVIEGTTADVTILMGDFNEWLPWGRPLRRLNGIFVPLGAYALATFPSRRPFLALDRIWVRPARFLKPLKVYMAPPARMASDHLPLVADLAC
jgi:endonuclease/exonuclease/phosphatase family metal-dependent hydrolase